MRIEKVKIFNFRRLKNCEIQFGDETTVFVGANNSGKTTAMYCLEKFIKGAEFGFYDLSVDILKKLDEIGEKWINDDT